MKNFFKNLLSKIKRNWLFLIVLGIAVFLRLYRIGSLTTFGVDQGVDFLVVRDMVLFHKWTLIGIKSSIGEFFQGPIALYIMFPFFVLFYLNPIAGAYTAFTLSLMTLLILYVTVDKYYSRTSALFASLMFAVSPELIMYGNSPLYQHFLPLLIIIGLFFLLKKEKKILDFFVIGLTAGLGMELHFLNITLVITVLIYFLIYENKGIRKLVSYFVGLMTGLLPTILFELRHNFLNIRLFLEYISQNGSGKFTLQKYLQWLTSGARFVAGNNNYFAALILIGFFYLIIASRKMTSETKLLKRLAVILFIIINLMLLPLKEFYSQYAEAFWLIVIILIPVLILNHTNKKYSYTILTIIVLVNFTFSFSRLSYNHGYNMPDGVTLNKIEKMGEIVAEDSKSHPNFNIASLLDGGTRGYSLRYSTLIRNANPQSYVDYPSSNFLYVVGREDKNYVLHSNTWEVKSLVPFKIGNEWNMGENVYLYRLDRILEKPNI